LCDGYSLAAGARTLQTAPADFTIDCNTLRGQSLSLVPRRFFALAE